MGTWKIWDDRHAARQREAFDFGMADTNHFQRII